MNEADALLGSDVQPCVLALVEVCVAIFCASLPTFPALFHVKSIRNIKKPSVDPRSMLSSLAPEERRRSGYRSSPENTHKESMKMANWAEIPKCEEWGSGPSTRDTQETV